MKSGEEIWKAYEEWYAIECSPTKRDNLSLSQKKRKQSFEKKFLPKEREYIRKAIGG